MKQFLQQSWTNSELLVIDDSPSNQRVRVAGPRVKVIYPNERMSLGAKHNLGLELAQSEILSHWDDDDWQAPRRLIHQVEALALGKADICGYATDLLMTTGDAKFWRFDRTFIPTTEYVGNSMTKVGVPFMDGTAMWWRKLVGDIRYPDIAVSQKVKFLYDVWKMRNARVLRLPNDGMYIYVRHSNASSAHNTWQYMRDRRLLAVNRPPWFSDEDMEFYRNAV